MWLQDVTESLVSHYRERIDAFKRQLSTFRLNVSDSEIAQHLVGRWARKNFRSKLKDATLVEFRSICKDPDDTPLLLQQMVEHDFYYIKGMVVDYFVFEWSMDVITWYVYTFFSPGCYIIMVILYKVYCPQDQCCQWVSTNQFKWTMDNIIHNPWTGMWNKFHVEIVHIAHLAWIMIHLSFLKLPWYIWIYIQRIYT